MLNSIRVLFLLLLGVSLAQAAVVIERDITRDLIIGPTLLLQTPGQAFSFISASVGTGLPGGGTVVNNCLILEAQCTAGPGVAMLDADLSINGISALGSATAGDDMASSGLAASSVTSSSIGASTRLDVISGDFQQLSFNVAGSGLPDFIDVDISFSVSATIGDNSSVTSGATYFPFASAGVEVLEAVVGPPGFPPATNAAFTVLATNDTSGTMELLNATETFSVRPNENYWLRIITQSDVTFISGGDYNGLDLTFDTYADPIFALNSAFAADNPEIAGSFSVERIGNTVVPLPGALGLLLSGFAALGLMSRRRSIQRAS